MINRDPAIQTVLDNFPAARPKIGLILGSGWSALADIFQVRGDLAYINIPGLGAATVAGHPGRLILGALHGLETMVFLGRRHWYENAGWDPVLLPVRICRALGVQIMVLTNAAGALNPEFAAGEVMLITDHINAMGVNPLAARTEEEREPFFVDQTDVYTPYLREIFRQSAHKIGQNIQTGVYVAVSGPSYETPAETRMFRNFGADAIGMSTVPEAMLARAFSMQVLGVSCIANAAAGVSAAALTHADVTRNIASAMPALCALFKEFLALLAAHMQKNAL